MMRLIRTAAAVTGVVAACTFVLLPSLRADRTRQSAVPEGLHEAVPTAHALVGGRVVVSPGSVLEKATIIVRDGVIERVGVDVKPPADARVWDMAGKTVYAGFIDAYTEPSESRTGNADNAADRAELLRPAGGAQYYNGRVLSQYRAADAFKPDADLNKQLRSQGVVARLVAPQKQIIKGTSTLVSTADVDPTQVVLRPTVAMHARLTPERGASDRSYPNSPMGALTLVRQALLDARCYAAAHAAWSGNPAEPRPEQNDALEALSPVVAGSLPIVVDAPDELYSLRADRLGKEFNLRTIVRGHGQEYRRLSLIAETKRPVLLPVNFPKPPAVASPEQAAAISLDTLMMWDLAPENPARLDSAGVPIALTTDGLKDTAQFLTNVRKAVRRGLSPQAALKALTITPADLLGIARTHGSIERGKSASFVVSDGDLFSTGKPTVLETWVDGRRYEVTPALTPDPRGQWALTIAARPEPITFDIKIAGTPTKLVGELLPDAVHPATQPAATQPAASQPAASQPAATQPATRPSRPAARVELTNLAYLPGQISFTLKAKLVTGGDGVLQVSGVVVGDTLLGRAVLPGGRTVDLTGDREKPHDPTADADSPDESKAQEAKADDAKTDDAKPNDEKSKDNKPEASAASAKSRAAGKDDPTTRPALYDVNFPLGAYGRSALPDRPRRVLFKNATVWTSGPAGKLERASVLVEDGRIAAVSAANATPDADMVIDCQGKHLTPGIIDCHSHIATDGGINESGRAITCNVRIADFIDPDDISIYRQLAGGVTSSNILHGSANPIGGQNQVIKLRWGAGPEQMKFDGAPAGVKFALGENPKQANWGDRYTTRYPQSRMGVEQIIRDRFNAARDYIAAKERFKAAGEKGAPPRVDLELEALAEIVTGKRFIHAHSYRQDEILALLRTCEQFGVQVATLQHILEGYKVADAIAKHGAGASSFSDWWAYKVEVMDAIPYNGAIMHKAGVVVSFNSDDAELARRLNLEAAKAVKYGGVSETEALKFVTLNPAKQLRIDKFVGSIEVGKQADLVVWSGSPLSTMSRCEQTWIDGRRYFDVEEDRQLRMRDNVRRAGLVQRALAAGAGSKDDEPKEPRERDRWVRYDIFCGASKGAGQ